MGKVIEEQKKREQLQAKLFADLMWYIGEMNELIKRLTEDVNNLNAILQSDVRDYKEGKTDSTVN